MSDVDTSTEALRLTIAFFSYEGGYFTKELGNRVADTLTALCTERDTLRAKVDALEKDAEKLRGYLGEQLQERTKYLPKVLSDGAPNYSLFAAIAETAFRWKRVGGEHGMFAQLLFAILDAHASDKAAILRNPTEHGEGE